MKLIQKFKALSHRFRALPYRKKDAILLMIFLVIMTIVIFGISVIPAILANINLSSSLTFSTAMVWNFNGQLGTPADWLSDITINMTFTFPKGTLIVDNPIYISGIAYVNKTQYPDFIGNITHILVSYNGALAYPPAKDNYSLPAGAELDLFPTPKNDSVLTGNVTMSFPTEGNYTPLLGFDYTNATSMAEGGGSFSYIAGTGTEPALTVYPKTQYAQIVSNETSIAFTLAIYFLTLVSALSVIFYLWDWEPAKKEPTVNFYLWDWKLSDGNQQNEGKNDKTDAHSEESNADVE